MVVQRHENVLSVPAIDAIAVAIEHKDIEEIRPAIDLAPFVDAAAAANHSAAAGRGDFEPDFIRVGGALGERVAEFQRADHGFQQVAGARLQRGHGRSQRRVQTAVEEAFRAAFADAKQIDSSAPLEELLVFPHRFGRLHPVADRRVRRREAMAVDAWFPGVLEERRRRSGPEIVRFLERHVAVGAARFRLFRVIEASGAMPRRPA